ncbi:MAG: DUF2845 domain-containing protein, partial [Deltaproteobacteria bacterium]|nr:DUF2845 domain-containing protein [Deltaproteobacteria bacterium]
MKIGNSFLIVSIFLLIVFSSSIFVFAAQEATTMMCDEGIVNIGDMDVDVQNNCGQPDSQNMNEWVYNFGPSEPVYTVIFKEG